MDHIFINRMLSVQERDEIKQYLRDNKIDTIPDVKKPWEETALHFEQKFKLHISSQIIQNLYIELLVDGKFAGGDAAAWAK
jgi:hypothetical protein